MPGEWWSVAVVGAVCGGALTSLLTSLGMRQLGHAAAATTPLRSISGVVGGLASAAAVATSQRVDITELTPGMLVWGCALVSAAACDAVTQRIPTPLIRQAFVVTAALLTIGLGMAGDWGGLVLSGAGTLAAGLTMLLSWRYAGAGFGDVRLAALGGLGLGHATPAGLLLGLAALTAIVTTQAVVALVRGGTRRTLIPYGPALVGGCLVAAAF